MAHCVDPRRRTSLKLNQVSSQMPCCGILLISPWIWVCPRRDPGSDPNNLTWNPRRDWRDPYLDYSSLDGMLINCRLGYLWFMIIFSHQLYNGPNFYVLHMAPPHCITGMIFCPRPFRIVHVDCNVM